MDPNIHKVSDAFSKQSFVFDDLYTTNLLSEYMRKKFREELVLHLKPQSHILELNCGTGMDTLYIAGLGHTILATDNADGMLQHIKAKVEQHQLHDRIQIQKCNFEHLEQLQPQTFDHIYSNFSGLNCTQQLNKVLQSMTPLLNDKGKISIVIMPKICPWELIMLFRGQFKTAFRRFKKGGTDAHIEGTIFKCFYYNPNYVIKALKKDFKVVSLKGMSITVPPPFIEHFVERHPKWFKVLSKLDGIIEKWWPFTVCCDQYMITLEKR